MTRALAATPRGHSLGDDVPIRVQAFPVAVVAVLAKNPMATDSALNTALRAGRELHDLGRREGDGVEAPILLPRGRGETSDWEVVARAHAGRRIAVAQSPCRVPSFRVHRGSLHPESAPRRFIDASEPTLGPAPGARNDREHFYVRHRLNRLHAEPKGCRVPRGRIARRSGVRIAIPGGGHPCDSCVLTGADYLAATPLGIRDDPASIQFRDELFPPGPLVEHACP